MDKTKLLKSYLSNMQVDVSDAHYTKVNINWKAPEFIPSINRFYYIVEGEGRLTIDGEVFHPKPGQLFLMPAGVKQSYSTISDDTFAKHWCHFTAMIGEMHLFQILKIPFFIEVRDPEHVTALFQRLSQQFGSPGVTGMLRTKATMLELLSYFLEHTVIENIRLAATDSVEKLTAVLRHIDSHLTETVSVEELAKLAHLHPNYFIKFFKAHLGDSPIQYINKRKLDHAKTLLRTTNLSIKEIAEATGMDLHYFSRLFKQAAGMSPTVYRTLRE
ncbi:AraC family transcriptional regulator [Paenibacillus sp. MBLB4367]|uniref:AraC family transcriptional regulator n=1 Tax=Paenibacillus sp. MBLB4367 TaxID=3384767 RepID=UPI003907FADF